MVNNTRPSIGDGDITSNRDAIALSKRSRETFLPSAYLRAASVSRWKALYKQAA